VAVGDGVAEGVGEAVVGVGLGVAAFFTTVRVIWVLVGTRYPERGVWPCTVPFATPGLDT